MATEKAPARILSFDEFVQADGVDFLDVPVRGGVVRIGTLTAADWVEWTELRESGPEGRKTSGATLIIRSLVNENGQRIGDETKLEQVKKMNLKTSETLLKAIFQLNGISQQDGAKAKNA